MLISKNLREKSSEISIKTRSTPATLSLKGPATKHTAVKWPIKKRQRQRFVYSNKGIILVKFWQDFFGTETQTIVISLLNNNRLLIELARAVLGNIGPRSWQYGPSDARSVLPRPRANIPQYGPSKLG